MHLVYTDGLSTVLLIVLFTDYDHLTNGQVNITQYTCLKVIL